MSRHPRNNFWTVSAYHMLRAASTHLCKRICYVHKLVVSKKSKMIVLQKVDLPRLAQASVTTVLSNLTTRLKAKVTLLSTILQPKVKLLAQQVYKMTQTYSKTQVFYSSVRSHLPLISMQVLQNSCLHRPTSNNLWLSTQLQVAHCLTLHSFRTSQFSQIKYSKVSLPWRRAPKEALYQATFWSLAQKEAWTKT